MHFSSYYRWIVATEYLGMPRRFDDSVLDIGAGRGHFLSRIEAPLKIGIDLSVPRSHLAPLIQADACRLPYPDRAFGHVLAFDVFEHVEDDRLMASEALRVLTDGGAFWLSAPADQFTVYPDRLTRTRLSTSWGHVRRGYSRDDILGRFPDAETDITVFYWNEPILRGLYVPLKLLFDVFPPLMPRVVPIVVASDASHRQGNAGHLFARVRRRIEAT